MKFAMNVCDAKNNNDAVLCFAVTVVLLKSKNSPQCGVPLSGSS